MNRRTDNKIGDRLESRPGERGEGRRESLGKSRKEIRGADFRENGRRIREVVADLLYPPRCPICDEVLDRAWRNVPAKKTSSRVLARISVSSGGRCCPSCAAVLPRIGETRCLKCGKPVEDESREYCGDCRTQRHFFDRGVAAFTYTEAMRHCVYRMKAENRRDYIPFCAEEMTKAVERFLPRWRPEIIVPVPMHPRKRRRRGYNQSELLARELGRRTGIPVESGLLYCTRIVRSQKELGRQERMRNLRDSFAAREPFPPVSRVLLADDVYTTGSTMDEISRVLRKHGVREIYFVVLCTGKGKKTVCMTGKV